MKTIIPILVLCVLSACKSTTAITNNTKVNLQSECPECSVMLLQNKSVSIKQDDTMAYYYNLTESTTHSVIKVSYTSGKSTYQDSGYIEEFIFMIPNNSTEANWQYKEITKTNALLNIQCYCKGKAGIYQLTNGNISLKNNTIAITLPELVSDQKLHELTITLK